ncbi:ribosome assembly protein 4-like isoform X3 [Pocillopora damicornis]|uniref:ribosome assembly protein 4-like isoform X3 n=1 Tax=Pocillopora damicornis TaxID=46731 RepID=UPI000F553692|nr:ribosome assembly protein 4-like isoform X3 [Pocillopora damicornis]
MADGRDGLSFLPNVKASTCKQGKKTKRVAFKNLQRPLVLPSLELSTVDLQSVSSLFSHKQICKKVCEWFTDWRSWQQRILLCGVSEKCTKSQLQAFVTMLEPVFHRDFTARLKGIYPTTRIRARLVHTATVCYRWRFLTNESRLWKAKIASLGASEGIENLTEKIEVLGHGQAVDWKQAYREVKNYYKDLAMVKLEKEEEKATELKEKLEAARCEEMKKQSKVTVTELPPKPIIKDEPKAVYSNVAEIMIAQVMENVGPAQSAPTADQKEHGDEFTAADFDGNDLTGGNLKLLTRSLKALADGGDKPEDLDVALDVRPTLVQASNLLATSEGDGERGRQKFRYLSLAVQGVFSVRRVRRLQGHMDAIFCLQFDKRRIITGSADRTIRMWDVRSGRSIHKLKGHKGGVRCLQFDDEKIVSGSWDMTIMVWHIVKFHRLKVLYGHSGCVSCLQFKGKILVSGSHDRTLRIWDTDTWECESEIEGHEGAVTCLQLNGDYLVSGSIDRTLKLWDIKTRACLHTFEGHKDAVLAVTVLGNLIISGSADGMIMFWNLETGFCEAAIQGHEGPVHSLDYNGHQHFFSSGGDNLLKEWDLSTCTCLRSLQGHKGPVFCVKAVPHRVVSCSADGFTRIWDLNSLPEGKGLSKAIAVQENVITPTKVVENSLEKSLK